MTKFFLLCSISTFITLGAGCAAFAAEPLPCENMLSDLKAAVGAAKIGDAEAAKVAELQSKGLERCKADDDAGADAYFAEALKLLGK